VELELGNFINPFLDDFSNDNDSSDTSKDLELDAEDSANYDIKMGIDDEQEDYESASSSRSEIERLFARNENNNGQISILNYFKK